MKLCLNMNRRNKRFHLSITLKRQNGTKHFNQFSFWSSTGVVCVVQVWHHITSHHSVNLSQYLFRIFFISSSCFFPWLKPQPGSNYMCKCEIRWRQRSFFFWPLTLTFEALPPPSRWNSCPPSQLASHCCTRLKEKLQTARVNGMEVALNERWL